MTEASPGGHKAGYPTYRLDKEFFTELAGSLPRRVQERVDAGLKLALDLL